MFCPFFQSGFFFFKWYKENPQPPSPSQEATVCPSLDRLFVFFIASLGVKTQFRNVLIDKSRLYWKEKPPSCFRNTGLFANQALEMTRGISVGFSALRSERPLPDSCCSQIQSPVPPAFTTVFLGNCLPAGPTLLSVLSLLSQSQPLPANPHLLSDLHTLLFLFAQCSLQVSLDLLNQLPPTSFPLYIYSFNPQSWKASHIQALFSSMNSEGNEANPWRLLSSLSWWEWT